ncbi:hypothetical protein HPB52_017560 [Rhipicephalus sanguineus]|uniref:Regulatory protein zeste n=1 Tax=Rhipicephalus sanguineus TaxID=34632 RepID=A0A9D4PS68_RHISA|nr:hypothetical protein HPB52_017560 [Rhipicephalus sanguineus]
MEKKKINFSEEERAVLLDLLSRHRSVVENKRTDAASASRKRDSGKKIEDEFNSHHNVTPRKWTQLKKCGGTPPSSEMTDELQRVRDIASHIAVRLPNPCDSDRSWYDAGGSQSSNQLCTPVAALLSQTQDTPLRVRCYGSFVFFSLPMF